MELEIDRKILKETVRCKHEFRCIKNCTQIGCKVDSLIEKKILFIKCQEANGCSYKIAFGFDSNICTCPTRKEIFSKYGK